MAVFNPLKEGNIANINVMATTGRGLGISHVNCPTVVLVHAGGSGLLETKVFEEGTEIEKPNSAVGGGDEFGFSGGKGDSFLELGFVEDGSSSE
jgi:hypothetical protein